VCERHPRIRLAFLESGGGSIAPWLDRMDRPFDDQGFNDSGVKTRPSELFKRDCWIVAAGNQAMWRAGMITRLTRGWMGP
jgi:hypothetical protein